MQKSSISSGLLSLFILILAVFQAEASGSITVSGQQLPNFKGVYPGNFSDVQFYYVQGQGLTQPLQISVDGNFKVSLDCHDNFGNSITLNHNSGNVASTRIFVRFFPTDIGDKSGVVSHSSADLQPVEVSVAGAGIESGIPDDYYSTATGFGSELKTQLHNIINNHTVYDYSDLWAIYEETDATFSGQVWDMYSDIACQEPPYIFNFGPPHQDTGSGGTTEGDKFNREHSFPQSWYGGSGTHPMRSDLFHVFPTDKLVNAKRGNFPYGMVNNPSWTSQNGSKLGPNTISGYSGTAFEPIDAYKGDIARGFFYVVTRYQDEVHNWTFDASGIAMLDNQTFPGFKPWALNMLRQWHENDPVSQKEILRNNAIYSYQLNRNPFIDHPEFVEMIWSPTASILETQIVNLEVFPNPATDWVVVNSTYPEFRLEVFNSSGQLVVVYENVMNNNPISLSGLTGGMYFLVVRTNDSIQRARVVKVN